MYVFMSLNFQLTVTEISYSRYLQSQIGSLNDEQHRNTAERLQRIEVLVTPRTDSMINLPPALPPRDLIVPDQLGERFRTAFNRHRALIGKSNDDLSLHDGLDAFFMHYNSVSIQN